MEIPLKTNVLSKILKIQTLTCWSLRQSNCELLKGHNFKLNFWKKCDPEDKQIVRFLHWTHYIYFIYIYSQASAQISFSIWRGKKIYWGSRKVMQEKTILKVSYLYVCSTMFFQTSIISCGKTAQTFKIHIFHLFYFLSCLAPWSCLPLESTLRPCSKALLVHSSIFFFFSKNLKKHI